ncbi:MAG: hypothetical protein WBC89_06725 [Dehalococcoidia bacterium]
MITTLSALLIVTAVVTVYYWADFFIRGGVHVTKEDWYLKFERAFPPADLWMSACAIAGAAGLLMGQTYGLVFALLAAGSLLFLGLMDITFSIQNGLYRLLATSSQMKFELLINVWTLGLGIALIFCLSPKMAFV